MERFSLRAVTPCLSPHSRTGSERLWGLRAPEQREAAAPRPAMTSHPSARRGRAAGSAAQPMGVWGVSRYSQWECGACHGTANGSVGRAAAARWRRGSAGGPGCARGGGDCEWGAARGAGPRDPRRRLPALSPLESRPGAPPDPAVLAGGAAGPGAAALALGHGQRGSGSRFPAGVQSVPAHRRAVGMKWFFRFVPTPTIPWFLQLPEHCPCLVVRFGAAPPRRVTLGLSRCCALPWTERAPQGPRAPFPAGDPGARRAGATALAFLFF